MQISSDEGLEAYSLGADGAGCVVLNRPMGGTKLPYDTVGGARGEHFLLMDGKPVFKWAIRLVEENIREVTASAGIALDQIRLFILHQANERIIDGVADALKLDRSLFVKQLTRYGNTSAGSIPLALDECLTAGRVRRGDPILMSGFGAGLAWGTGIWRW